MRDALAVQLLQRRPQLAGELAHLRVGQPLPPAVQVAAQRAAVAQLEHDAVWVDAGQIPL